MLRINSFDLVHSFCMPVEQQSFFGCKSQLSMRIRGPPRISCTKEGGIGSKRKGRGGGKRDPRLDEREEVWPFLQIQERMIKDSNKQILVDAENLLERSNNKFGLVLEISEEANEYLRHNKDESLYRKPVLKIMSDRINEGAGEVIRDSYIEEAFDPNENP